MGHGAGAPCGPWLIRHCPQEMSIDKTLGTATVSARKGFWFHGLMTASKQSLGVRGIASHHK